MLLVLVLEKKLRQNWTDITNYLKDFDKITVRENDGLRILRENGVLGEQVLDPTLLLNINDWNLVMENINLPMNIYYCIKLIIIKICVKRLLHLQREKE